MKSMVVTQDGAIWLALLAVVFKETNQVALPTNSETVERFEKTLIVGFSCINTCLAFDTNILMPNV